MKPLTHYLRRYWKWYLFGFVSMLISIGLDMLSPQITKHIINDVILDGRMEILMKLLLGLAGIGIGRALFEAMRKDYAVQEFTVNSSPYAVEVYRHLGFEPTDCEQTEMGLRFTPMLYRSEDA